MTEQNLNYTGTWIMAYESQPKPEEVVFVYCMDNEYKYKTTAFYVAEAFTCEADTDYQDDELMCDFCEKTQTSFLKPGWYDYGLNTYCPIDGAVIAWTPWPPKPVLANLVLTAD